MAVVAPFRALRYDPENTHDLGKVVAPPYDVVSPEQQESLYQSSQYNVIRLELNKTRETDVPGQDRYTRAADNLKNWMSQGVLRREEKPAFYVSETTYTGVNGETLVRKGFFTLLRLEEFSAGVVLPHERTFTGHKEDRLKLLKASSTNISPIFALYPDEENRVQSLLRRSCTQTPVADFTDPMGLGQKMYLMEDPAVCEEIQEMMADKVIFIADGHHRYETALNYRTYMRQMHPRAPENSSFNYVMVYLCSMSDPGLTVFPCHRVLPEFAGFAARDFLLHAQNYFEHKAVDLTGDPVLDKENLTRELALAGEGGRGFGLVSAESDKAYVLTLKRGSVQDQAWLDMAQPLKALDVVVLTDVILERVLGLDNNARDQVHTISYVSDMAEVIRDVRLGKARVGFLLNPTKVEQVEDVAKAGLIMPRKSTYFYPKVLTGLTMNLIDPEETAPTCRG